MIEKPQHHEDEPNREMFPPPEASIIDAKTVKRIREFIDGNQALQEAIDRDDEELRLRKQHWAEYSEKQWGGQNRISLPDFLKAHRVVERNATHQKKVWDRKWMESLRWANDAEKQFLATVANIGQGKFVEVLQIALMQGGQLIGKDAAVGSGTEVTQENIDQVIKNLNVVLATPDTVYIVHNHFDGYNQLTLPKDEEAKDGLATVGGLSKRDIEFSDKLWTETLNQKARVIMIAINERGLTFAYEAGTSEYRDWQNDPQ